MTGACPAWTLTRTEGPPAEPGHEPFPGVQNRRRDQAHRPHGQHGLHGVEHALLFDLGDKRQTGLFESGDELQHGIHLPSDWDELPVRKADRLADTWGGIKKGLRGDGGLWGTGREPGLYLDRACRVGR